MRHVLLAALLMLSQVGFGDELSKVTPLTFQSWKESQILEAQNRTLRVSARIAQIKAGNISSATTKDAALQLTSSRLKRAENNDPLVLAEKDMARAQEGLQAANDLTLEDYVNVYLPTLKGSPDTAALIAQRLSKEELAEIFKLLVSGPSRQSPGLVGGLSPSPRLKFR